MRTVPRSSGEEQSVGAMLEERVAAAWAEALEVSCPLDVHENFFAAGGNSLQVPLIASYLSESLGVEVPVRLFFQSPTVAGFARRVERLLKESHARLSPIPRRSTSTPPPLSFAQERFFAIDRLDARRNAYNVPVGLEVEGPLDLDALRCALETVIGRHEVLRTSFVLGDDGPRAVVTDTFDVPFEIVDLRGVAPDERKPAAVDHLIERAHTPFDLARAPLVRMDVVRVQDDWNVVLLNMHHIATDARSFDIVVHELREAYAAFAAGETPGLPDVAVQYGDYAAWERSAERAPDLEAQVEYWRNQLREPLRLLDLPLDYPRPARPSGRGATVVAELPGSLVRDLRDMTRQLGLSTFMALLAAFDVVIYRHTGQCDVVIGAPSSNRLRPELERTVGCFVNTVALRTDLSGDPTFLDLLDRVSTVSLGAYAHQDIPFDRVVEELKRGVQRPLFNVMLNLKQQTHRPTFPGVSVTPLDLEAGTSHFDLALQVTEDGLTLQCALEFDTDLFSQETARRLLEHFSVVLESAVADPSRRVSKLTMLTPNERTEAFAWARGDGPPCGVSGLVHCLFEQQAAASPDAIAVVQGEQQLTYGEVHERASRLGRRLHDEGVRSEDVVALCADRGVTRVVGMLGILKAGAAFLLLDPLAPQTLPMQTRPSLLLAGADVSAQLPAGQARVAVIEELLAVENAPTEEPRPGLGDADSLAALVGGPSSGGAGRSVQVTHGQLSQSVSWARDALGLGAGDRVLHAPRLPHAWSAYELLLPLCSGAALVAVTLDQGLTPEETAELANAEAVTTLHVTPRDARRLVDAGTQLTALRNVCFVGESPPLDLIATLRSLTPVGCRIWSMYGHPECGPVAAAALVDERDLAPRRRARAPLGRPAAGSCWVLGVDGDVAPTGVPGRLWIGGPCVARGYADDPAATAERFGPEIVAGAGRVFLTEDVVRRLPDGQLEFLWRDPESIDVAGIRFDADEIEDALRRHPVIADAAVVADKGSAGEPRLIAYIVTRSDAGSGEGELRRWLADEVPAYMHADRLVRVEALPLTEQGMLDREALLLSTPSPSGATPAARPLSPLEQQISAVWRDAIEADGEVTVESDFFALGGTSITVARVISTLRQRLGLEIPMRYVFERPVLQDLAHQIELLRWTVEVQRLRTDTGGDREEGEL